MSTQTFSNNRRIAKNTLFLYVRMLFIMCVTLYTSRVVLDKLGVVDYGLYNTVGGLVAMLAFLNGTLSTGTSRFLTFELGTKNQVKLKATFCTTFYVHLILALIIFIIMETGGLWFVYNRLIIPPERLTAAVLAFHISILTSIVSITQVPYTSVIVAHENMKVYAYMGIFEVVAKLIVVFFLSISSWDRLIFYAILMGVIQLLVALSYRIYCIRHYFESHLTWNFDKQICRKMLSFSGWGLLAFMSVMLTNQGVIVLINMFFQPAIVAAQAIGNQITNAIMQFANGVRTAVNPQIIKLYASHDYEASKKLNLQSSIYVFDLLLFLGLPTIVVMEPLLKIWLVKVPDYAVIFAQYIIIQQIINSFSAAFYTSMIASGKLKENSYASVCVFFSGFIILYILLRLGCDVMYVQYIGLAQFIIYGFIIQPYILCKRIGYIWTEIFSCLFTALKVLIFPLIVSFLLITFWGGDSFLNVFMKALTVAMSVAVSAYIWLDKESRIKLHTFIINKTRRFLK